MLAAMTGPSTETSCPVCSERDLEVIIRIPGMPLVCGQLFHSPEAARGAASGDLDLVQCQTCSHIFNAAFDPQRLSYDEGYENSLHHSPTFSGYADGLARDLVDVYGVHDSNVVEIGCGDGRFLKAICEAGGNRGYGFDPSQQDWTWDSGNGAKLEVTSDLFATNDLSPKLLCCRHVLEHLNEPAGLLDSLRQDRFAEAGTVFYFEVPNGDVMKRPEGVWDHIYEHYSCFTLASLTYLFRSKGFHVLEAGTAFADQYLWVHARLDGEQRPPSPAPPDRDEARRTRHGYQGLIGRWRERLAALKADCKEVAVWGAGAKGSTFINLVDAAGAIDAVVDINPNKHGRFMPGTLHRVIKPEELLELKPSVIIVMNPMYLDEIAESVRNLGFETEFVTPS